MMDARNGPHGLQVAREPGGPMAETSTWIHLDPWLVNLESA